MSETAKVRLVRCPKCENLLPEVTDYSVYQCGGCGAVLRAKNKGVDLDTFSEKSYEENIEGSIEKLSDKYEKMMNVSERRMLDTSDGSESDVRSTVSSSSRAESRRTLRNRGENRRTNLTSKEQNWDLEADMIQGRKSDDFRRGKVAQDFKDLEIYEENDHGSRRLLEGRNGDINEMEGLRRDQRIDAEVMRHRREGPSNLFSRSGYDYEDPPYGFNNVDYIGDDRDELLRKLDEIKFQLSRSGNLTDKGKEKMPLDRRMALQDPYASGNWVSKQNSYHDSQSKRPTYPNQYAYTEPPPIIHRQEMGGNGFYSPRYASNNVQAYEDPSRSHINRRNSSQAYDSYISPSHVYKSGPYMDDGMMYMDDMEPYPPNVRCHQFTTRIMPTSYSDKYSDVSNKRISDHRNNLSQFGSRDYNRRIPDPAPPLKPHNNAQLHARWPSDVNSEVDGFILHRPPKVRQAPNGKHYLPIAGGAPFLTCYNCFELLLLPKKVLMNNNDKKAKMSCGACSTVIVFTVSNKKLVFSSDMEPTENNPVKINKHDELLTNGNGHVKEIRAAFTSDDYDNSGYDFHPMDKAKLLADIKNRHSTSTYFSEVEEDNKSLSDVRRDSSLAAVSKDDKGTRPLAGSSLQDHFEYSNIYHVANRLGEGNRSELSEKDKVLPNKNTDKQKLRKESSATEIDLSSNEYWNTGTTIDSAEASREGDRLKASRAAKTFFAGIGFNDSNRLNEDFEQEKANVTVNGHLISGRLIKKAEKLAGPIHPGNYWYDFRAGFWGAIGGPCLGIIPPFIEEFNYPMPEHCAGGSTNVFINGRELNQKDLNLLVSRGLPTERDRSYIVEISGRVLDEGTGEELESLGKLAPTVEKLKHGFGMRPPNAVA